MAQMLQYSCDICNRPNAIHLVIPGVDIIIDAFSRKEKSLEGCVDLCTECLPKQISHAIENLSWNDLKPGKEMRRYFWRELFKK